MSKAVHDADSCKLIRRRSVAVMRIGAPIEMPEMSVPNFGSRSLASLQSFTYLFGIIPITGRSRVPFSKESEAESAASRSLGSNQLLAYLRLFSRILTIWKTERALVLDHLSQKAT